MQNTKDNKQAILDTALDLFSEHGYESVGVQMLCDNSGITKPTLYYYFGSKDGVLKELLGENYHKLNAQLEKSAVYTPHPHSYDHDVFPVLTALAKTYYEFARQNEKFYRLVMYSTYAPPTSTTGKLVRELSLKQYDIIEKMFTKMAEYHGNMKGNERRLAWTFIGLINAYISLGTFTSTTVEETVRQFMHGIYT